MLPVLLCRARAKYPAVWWRKCCAYREGLPPRVRAAAAASTVMVAVALSMTISAQDYVYLPLVLAAYHRNLMAFCLLSLF